MRCDGDAITILSEGECLHFPHKPSICPPLYVLFGQVEKAEKGELLAVGVEKYVVGYGGERGFSVVVGADSC